MSAKTSRQAGKPLRLAIEQGISFRFLFSEGTPGTEHENDARARIYANAINAEFYRLSAVSAGKRYSRRSSGRLREDDRPMFCFSMKFTTFQ